MTGTPTNPQSAVLIGLKPGGPLADLLRPLDSRACAVETFGDVYRALAHIGRHEPTVVVVAVDWLFSAAFEFFELMRRSHPDVSVLVVGPDRAAAKIQRALVLGADGIATAERLDALLAARAVAAAPSTRAEDTLDLVDGAAPGRDPGPSPVRETSETLASAGNVFDAELERRLRAQLGDGDIDSENFTQAADVSDEEASADGVAESEPVDSRFPADESVCDDAADADTVRVRVPWQAFENRPQRTPPKRTPPPGATNASPPTGEQPPPTKGAGVTEPPSAARPDAPASVVSREADDLPLLTPEELQALFADDWENLDNNASPVERS